MRRLQSQLDLGRIRVIFVVIAIGESERLGVLLFVLLRGLPLPFAQRIRCPERRGREPQLQGRVASLQHGQRRGGLVHVHVEVAAQHTVLCRRGDHLLRLAVDNAEHRHTIQLIDNLLPLQWAQRHRDVRRHTYGAGGERERR